MDQTGEITLLETALIGMLGMFLLAMAVIFFFLVYQRRLLKQQKTNQSMKAAYQKELLRASVDSQEKERLRIAQVLHDEVGALLTTAKLHLSQITSETPKQKFVDRLTSSGEILTESLQSVRRISLDLKPPVLETLGLVAATKSLTQKINTSGKVRMTYTSQDEIDIPFDEALGCYRIIQELLQNGIKHSGATQIELMTKQNGASTIIDYSDNGIGFDFDQHRSAGNEGLGLRNIESRLNLLNGRLFTLEKADSGVHLHIETHCQGKEDFHD